MRAALLKRGGGPEVLAIGEVPDPVPGDDDVLIAVEAISLEGGDMIGRQAGTITAPAVIGYAAAGEVLAVGAAVTAFRPGQKVATFGFAGSHAERRVAPAATTFHVPAGLDLGVAAAIPCGPGTAALTLDIGRLRAGETVLVTGAAGGVGLAVVQLAAEAGARVIGTGTSRESLEALRDYGLWRGVVTDTAPTSEQVRTLLDGEGVDLLIDNVGGEVLVDGLKAVRDGGRAVLVGVYGGFDTAIDAFHLLSHRLTVSGCFLGPVMGEPASRALIDDLLRRARDGTFRQPIDATFPLTEIAAAHARAGQRGRIGRVVVTP